MEINTLFTKAPEYLTLHGLNIHKIQQPLSLSWNPKEDITTFELAQALPQLLPYPKPIYEIDETLTYLRHFDIIKP